LWTKANAWPFYYGFQPSGRFPDQPFVREQYHNNLSIKLHRVPEPKLRAPQVQKPVRVQPITRPTHMPRQLPA
jgi:hypothetical protein